MTVSDKPISFTTEQRERLDAVIAAMRRGETNGVAELEALHREAPQWLEVIGHLAWACAHDGDFERSIALCREYLAIEPGNAEMHWRIGDRLINLGRIDEAERAYRETEEKFPDCRDARMGLRYVSFLKRRRKIDKEYGWHLSRPEPSPPSPARVENDRLNAEEFDRQAIRLKSMPSRLYLESTTKCNFYCQTCAKGYNPYEVEDLREGIFEQVEREVMPSVKRISITGFGEPTLAGNFDQILQMALDHGSTVHFVTNASLLNFERIEKLSQFPVDIFISVDGSTKETFEEIRAGSNFELILDKLAMIKKLRDINLSQFSSQFGFNFVALRRNIHELPDVLRLAHEYGIQTVSVADYAFNDNDFDQESLRNDAERANRYLAEAEQVVRELGMNFLPPLPYVPAASEKQNNGLFAKLRRIGPIFPKRRRFPQRCSSPWSEPYIRTDGTVAPCCTSPWVLGDLKKQSFRDVWNGWRYRLFRLRLRTPLPPLPCRHCFINWGINGGNAGNVMAKEGLLIKAIYWLEKRSRRIARRTIDFTRKMIGAFRRRPAAAPAPPEMYYHGKPFSEPNRPD